MLWRDVCRLDRFIDSHGVQVYNVISFQTSLPQLNVKAYNRSSLNGKDHSAARNKCFGDS